MKAPRYIAWSEENRSQLIRVPAAKGDLKRIELRSPDPCTNPYLAYALLIYAGLDGIKNNLSPFESVKENLYNASASFTANLDVLPQSFSDAIKKAEESIFVKNAISQKIIDEYNKLSR